MPENQELINFEGWDLHSAAEKCHVGMTFALIERGDDVNARDEDGFTPLLIYSNRLNRPWTRSSYGTEDHLKIAELLIKKGKADVNATISTTQEPAWIGRTALHFAATGGQIKLVALLIDHGACVDPVTSNTPETPLGSAFGSWYKFVEQHPMVKEQEQTFFEMVRLLVGHGANVNSLCRDGTSILGRAIANKHDEMIEFLLANGADPKRGVPLYQAVATDSLQLAELLIKKGAEVNAKGLYGCPPFCAVRSIELAQLLIKHGAVVDADICEGPMAHAAVNDLVELAELLIDNGADVNAKYDDGTTTDGDICGDVSLLHIAVEYGSLGVARLLLSHKVDVDASTTITVEPQYDLYPPEEKNHETPLFYAASNDSVELADLLINNGAIVDEFSEAYGRTPLSIACHMGNWKVAEFLVDSGANLEIQGQPSEVELAIKAGQSGIVKAWIEKGAEFKTSLEGYLSPYIHSSQQDSDLQPWAQFLPSFNALSFAIATEDHDLIELVVGKGANLRYGQPLHYAIAIDSSELVSRLIGEGLELFRCHIRHVVASNATSVLRLLMGMGGDIDFSTALQQAGQENNHEHANLLLRKGIDVNIQDIDGNASLHYAAMKNSIKVARLLLRSDTDYNLQNHAGKTPLFFAAIRDSLDVADLLVDRGASLETQDDDGNTALHFAAKHQSLKVARLLIEKGMCINKTNDSDITPLQEAKYASSVGDDDLGEVWATCKSIHQQDSECASKKELIDSKPAELFQEDMTHYVCSENTDNWMDDWFGKSSVQWDRGASIKPEPEPPPPLPADVEELPW